MQYTYKMKLKGEFPMDLADELGITNEDLLTYNQSGAIPLTRKAYLALKANKNAVESISINTDATYGDLYPLNAYTGWTRDNYGPVWIPKKRPVCRPYAGRICLYMSVASRCMRATT